MAIKSFNITVCASGGGGNFRSLAKHQFDCGYRISLLVVDRECFAIDVAKEYGIPEYGGKGMYGVKVQEAVLRNHEKYAGCTVHYVDEGIDTGEIIIQKRIFVAEDESAWELGGRVFNEEIRLLPLAIKMIREEMKTNS